MKIRLVMVALLGALSLLVVLSSGTSAESGYDMYVWSSDFQPGHSIFVNVTGPMNMSISIRITDEENEIVAGKDAVIRPDGNYSYEWSPSQEGKYNATVLYSTGLSITRSFVIQEKVTPQDIGEIYRALFALQDRVMSALGSVSFEARAALGLAGVSFVSSIIVFTWVRKNYSRADSEFETFLKQDVKSAILEHRKKGS